MTVLTSRDQSQQALIEHRLLRHLVDGLRATLEWQAAGDDFARKLSTLRFVSQSFQRHLERLLALEEYDGYLDDVAATTPQLARMVDALRRDHDQLRQATRRAVYRLEQVSSLDEAEFAGICDDLADLLDRVEAHSSKEVRLLQEAFHRDIGGEG
jgi:hemerythrin-like domain-containing protein